MAERQVLDEKTKVTCIKNEERHSLEIEIECPRCHDDMTLCSEFDNLYYSCSQCDFCLFTLKR